MPDGNPTPTLSDQLCFALYSTAHAVTRAYKPLLDEYGLTYPQYLVLLVLWEQDGMSVKDIGDRLFLDSGTLTPLLKRMEAAGFVRRNRDRDDERQLRVNLTNKAQDLRTKARDIAYKLFCNFGRPLPQLVALREDLNELRDQLHKSQSPEAQEESGHQHTKRAKG
jgi:MarR family transcriptional regulator, organic hydroperoxide resistance regulator